MSEILKNIDEMGFLRNHLTSEIDKLMQCEDQPFCRKFLSELRNLPLEMIEVSKIVYSSSREFISENVDPSLSDYAGFTFNGDNIFRERFIIPIFDAFGGVKGMSGYDSESGIKYLFTHTTFFSKATSFYNYQYIDLIYKNDYVILIEGFFDSIRLNSIGLYCNLALMGTMMMEYHRRILNRIGLKILMPDGDASGQKAIDYWSKLDGKVAIIRIKQVKVVDSRRTIDEDGKEMVADVEVFTKDIDAVLKFFPERTNDFKKLINRIVAESRNPFFRLEEYRF